MSENNWLTTPSETRTITNMDIQNILCQKSICHKFLCSRCPFESSNIEEFKKDKEKYLKMFIEACRE